MLTQHSLSSMGSTSPFHVWELKWPNIFLSYRREVLEQLAKQFEIDQIILCFKKLHWRRTFFNISYDWLAIWRFSYLASDSFVSVG